VRWPKDGAAGNWQQKAVAQATNSTAVGHETQPDATEESLLTNIDGKS